MNKELLIILYKFNVDGLSVQRASENIHNFVENNSLRDDIELKENYIIREIFMPIKNGDSDVKVIYPISVLSTDIGDLIREINEKMKDDNISNDIKKDWNKLLRELKVRILESDII